MRPIMVAKRRRELARPIASQRSLAESQHCHFVFVADLLRVHPPVKGTFWFQSSLEATRRSFNKDFLLALAADFKKHGAAAIEKVREQQPAAYMKICALLVPREMKLEHSGGVKAMTDEQVEGAIAAIEAWMAARTAGEGAKVIEGQAEVVPSLPAPGS